MAKGRINSVQSLGTVDGPGVRYVVFLQGCPLRCGCCHNPDTWDINGGQEYTPREIVEKAERCREYFGQEGGITLSGGEPLLQPEFCKEVFSLCKQKGINTCLDTSGCILNDKIKHLLDFTDMVLLDIKYTDKDNYKKYVGCDIQMPLQFLDYINQKKIPTVIRQVLIPTLNNTEENIQNLKELKKNYSCIKKIELLPFKKLCTVKYDKLNLDFAFKNIPTPTNEEMDKFKNMLE